MTETTPLYGDMNTVPELDCLADMIPAVKHSGMVVWKNFLCEKIPCILVSQKILWDVRKIHLESRDT